MIDLAWQMDADGVIEDDLSDLFLEC